VLALLFIYQTGGYVDKFDSQARDESLRDYGVWVRAGENLLLNKNPYLEDEILKSGTFSSLIFYLFFKLFYSNYLFFLLMQALNILGIIAYLHFFRLTSIGSTVTLFLMLTFSSTREVLVNGQTTGILIGMFAIAHKILNVIHNQLIKSTFLQFFGLLFVSLLLITGLDLKPNLMLIPTLILVIYYQDYRIILISLVFWSAHQIYFYLKLDELLIFSWIDNLRVLVSYESNPSFFGSIGIWQLLNLLNFPTLFLQVAPIVTFLVFALFSLSSLKRWGLNTAIFLAFLANYFYTYFHFYSFAPILAFLIFKLLGRRRYLIAGFSISSMQFSFNHESQIVLLASLGVLVLLLTLYTLPDYIATLFFCLGWVAFIPVKLVLFDLLDSEPLAAKSIITLVAIIFSMLGSWESYDKKQPSKTFD